MKYLLKTSVSTNEIKNLIPRWFGKKNYHDNQGHIFLKENS